eukprot:1161661-Pelagomonas_calceolata.AAC.6
MDQLIEGKDKEKNYTSHKRLHALRKGRQIHYSLPFTKASTNEKRGSVHGMEHAKRTLTVALLATVPPSFMQRRGTTSSNILLMPCASGFIDSNSASAALFVLTEAGEQESIEDVATRQHHNCTFAFVSPYCHGWDKHVGKCVKAGWKSCQERSRGILYSPGKASQLQRLHPAAAELRLRDQKSLPRIERSDPAAVKEWQASVEAPFALKV